MLSLKFIQENPDFVVERLAVKQFDAREIVDEVLELYRKRNEIQNEVDSRKAEMNKLSKEIGMMFKSGKTDEANAAKERTAELKESIKELDQEFVRIDEELMNLQVQLPNIPSPLVPEGRTAEDNLVVESGGVMPELGENAKPHWELAEQYDLINFELGVKITGAGFPVYKGWGARLQRALINFFLDQVTPKFSLPM